MTRILLFIKNDLFRLGIIAAVKEIENDAHLQESDNWENILNVVQNSEVDLLILEIGLSNLTNLNNVENIRHVKPTIKILILGEEQEKIWTLPYLKKGVNGICLKTISTSEFQSAIDNVLKGRKYLFEGMSNFLINGLLDHHLINLLSIRESEILQLLLKGFRTAEIAKQLNLAPSTISTMKFKIYRKMQVTNIVDLSNKVEASKSNM